MKNSGRIIPNSKAFCNNYFLPVPGAFLGT